MTDYNVLDYGARGDGVHNDAPAIQRTVDACHAAGGGRVVLPSGKTYSSGSIVLKSDIEFHVETGACLKASGDVGDYLIPVRPETGVPEYGGRPKQAFLYALGEKNLTLSGGGSIDGNAEAFAGKGTKYHIAGAVYPRPALIYLENCRHLTVKDITLQNSHFWTLHPAGCYDVLVSGIRILNRLDMANSDGIDPDHCSNVRIVNCHIEAADDCIVLKNTRDLKHYGPTENVVISGCTLISTSAAVKLGSESVSDFRNIVVDSCIISRSNRGLSIQLRDEGHVENVLFSNIMIETRRFSDEWWGRAEPIYVTAVDRNDKTKAGSIRGVRFYNITCRGENGIFIRGKDAGTIEELMLDNVRVEIVKSTKWEGGYYDLRPCMGDGILQRGIAGICCSNAKDVSLRHVKVVWGDNRPAYFGPALRTHNVTELVLENFKGKAAHPGERDIVTETLSGKSFGSRAGAKRGG